MRRLRQQRSSVEFLSARAQAVALVVIALGVAALLPVGCARGTEDL
jgi:hypothetical protein